MLVTSPEKRNSILYVRVSDKNKKYVEKEAKNLEVSESLFINAVIDQARRKKLNARSKKRIPKRTK